MALNEGITGKEGMADKDVEAYKMNWAAPYRGFTDGYVVLMELDRKVEVRAGNGFFFSGECIAHTREAVQGVRRLADIFTYKNVCWLV